MGFCGQDDDHLRAHMRIPFMVYDGCGDAGRGLNITVDNFSGGYQVGRHLTALGHRRALCISDNDVFLDHDRFEGFRSGYDGEAELLVAPIYWVYFMLSLGECVRFALGAAVFRRKQWMRSSRG